MTTFQSRQPSGVARAQALIGKASECRRLAEIAEPETREAYLRLARSYDVLAEDVVAKVGKLFPQHDDQQQADVSASSPT
jgi:hypothetical protein